MALTVCTVVQREYQGRVAYRNSHYLMALDTHAHTQACTRTHTHTHVGFFDAASASVRHHQAVPSLTHLRDWSETSLWRSTPQKEFDGREEKKTTENFTSTQCPWSPSNQVVMVTSRYQFADRRIAGEGLWCHREQFSNCFSQGDNDIKDQCTRGPTG